MRMRHGVVVDSGPGWADVELDGVVVPHVPVSFGKTLAFGETATLVQQNRSLIALAIRKTPPPPLLFTWWVFALATGNTSSSAEVEAWIPNSFTDAQGKQWQAVIPLTMSMTFDPYDAKAVLFRISGTWEEAPDLNGIPWGPGAGTRAAQAIPFEAGTTSGSVATTGYTQPNIVLPLTVSTGSVGVAAGISRGTPSWGAPLGAVSTLSGGGWGAVAATTTSAAPWTSNWTPNGTDHKASIQTYL